MAEIPRQGGPTGAEIPAATDQAPVVEPPGKQWADGVVDYFSTLPLRRIKENIRATFQTGQQSVISGETPPGGKIRN